MQTPESEMNKLYRRYDRVMELIRHYNEQPNSPDRSLALKRLNAMYSQICNQHHEMCRAFYGP
jgi:hypothetical protein